MLLGDVTETSRVHDPFAVGTLLGLVAARSGSLARYDSLAREIGVDGKTAKGYVDVLERLFLVRVRRAWHVNLGQRQVKAPKLYVADPGLLAGLVGADLRRVREDDGLAERPSGEVLGFEVKAGGTVRPADFRGLKRMREKIGERLVAGIVLYAGERTLPFGSGLWAVPLSALWAPR